MVTYILVDDLNRPIGIISEARSRIKGTGYLELGYWCDGIKYVTARARAVPKSKTKLNERQISCLPEYDVGGYAIKEEKENETVP